MECVEPASNIVIERAATFLKVPSYYFTAFRVFADAGFHEGCHACSAIGVNIAKTADEKQLAEFA